MIVILSTSKNDSPVRAAKEAVPLPWNSTKRTVDNRRRDEGGEAMGELRAFLDEEDGVTVVEIILILLVFVVLILLFLLLVY